jgi:protein-tyrosine phosphatase
MQIYAIRDDHTLFLAPVIDDWSIIEANRISAVVDLEGEIDHGIPTRPNHLLYVYFPIADEELPDLGKLDAVGDLGARLIRGGHRVLSHCGMGFNRSALVAGIILNKLGMAGAEAVQTIRSRRPGALFNEEFAGYLARLPAP